MGLVCVCVHLKHLQAPFRCRRYKVGVVLGSANIHYRAILFIQQKYYYYYVLVVCDCVVSISYESIAKIEALMCNHML